MHHPGGPISIPAIHNFVPEKLKPWIFILFLIIIQFSSGGIYMATINELVGGNDLTQEDVLMAGYASLVGTALTFTIMLRLKLRFISKHIFLVCGAVLVAANLISLYTNNIFVLVSVCFIAGIFRMWVTFECNSTIQLWTTPKRDLSIFFCFVYLLVQGSILLSGSTQIYVTFITTWQYVHWMMIGALLFMMLTVAIIFNNIRFIPKFPLFGIDWLGMLMWGLFMLCVNFVGVYGDHYDWLDSWQIQMASVFGLGVLGLNLLRASFIRHPFIPLQVFKYPIVYLSVFIYLLVDLFISPSHLIEEIYLHEILQYDVHHTITINSIGFFGIFAACAFTYFYFAKAKNSYKSTFLIGFAGVMVYLVMMYFTLDYNTSQTMYGISIFFRNFGYIIMAIVLITSLTKVPFNHFFQAITVQAIVSVACGSAVVGAVLHHLFSHTMTKNFQLLSANIDHVNPYIMQYSPAQIGGMLQHQALMVSFKEIYGLLIIISLLTFLFLLWYQFPSLPRNSIFPKWKTWRKKLKKEISTP
ncbi:MAG: hypothetical protein KBS61_08890 [Chryseobacterium sp.]|nr:hypothetical protein [Candidatus Chryseobacterium enterohippi]